MANSKTTRGVGDRSESRILRAFKSSLISAEETKNSGATRKDGDIKAFVCKDDETYIRGEAKYRNSDGWTLTKKHWEEITEKCLVHGGIPALFTENKSQKCFITMDLKHFLELISSYREDDEES